MPSGILDFNVLKNLSIGLNSGVYGGIVSLYPFIYLIYHAPKLLTWARALSYSRIKSSSLHHSLF